MRKGGKEKGGGDVRVLICGIADCRLQELQCAQAGGYTSVLAPLLLHTHAVTPCPAAPLPFSPFSILHFSLLHLHLSLSLSLSRNPPPRSLDLFSLLRCARRGSALSLSFG